jgi:long-subunit fatty acid transport protein
MKKVISSLALVVLIGVSAKAQTEKGYVMVGSQISNVHAEKSGFSINIHPGAAWFLSDNFALGGSVILGYSKPKDFDGTFSYGIEPMARLYFGKNAKNKFFGQVMTGFTGMSTDGNSSSEWHAGAGLGYNYFINKNVALELGAAYNYSKAKDTDGVSGFDLDFGFQIFLPTKKVKK